eukprot:10757802-Karenia_brevis.AAC.1
MLQREDVEVGIPEEILDEAGSQMSAGSSSKVQADSSRADSSMGWQSVPVELTDSSMGDDTPGGEAREREYEPDENRSETSE